MDPTQRLNLDDQSTGPPEQSTTIPQHISRALSRIPEITRNAALLGDNAMESLNLLLQPVVIQWALETCQYGVTHPHATWTPSALQCIEDDLHRFQSLAASTSVPVLPLASSVSPRQSNFPRTALGKPPSGDAECSDVEPTLDLDRRDSSHPMSAETRDIKLDAFQNRNRRSQAIKELQSSDPGPSDIYNRQEELHGGQGADSRRWSDLDSIAGKVASPEEIYQCLVSQAGDWASDTRRMEYLTRLFFHFGGATAIYQLQNALAAISRSERHDVASMGSRICALNRMEQADAFEKRILETGLCGESRELTLLQCEQSHDRDTAEMITLQIMMGCAYPNVDPDSVDYAIQKEQLQASLSKGRNWTKAQSRCPSALFLFPPDMSENEFRQLPEALLDVFFDVLYQYRGDFLRRIDEELGPLVAKFLAGKRPGLKVI